MIRGFAIAAALAACACAPHKIQYYQLSAVPAAPPPVANGPTILVGRIAAPQAFQDGRIRYRAGANELGAYEYHRWADPPSLMVRDALIRTLRDSGKYGSVQETSAAAHGDYTVRGKLLEFTEIDGPGIETRVSLDLELREIKTGRVVWNQVLTHSDPVAAKKVSDVVASLDRCLRAVIAEASNSMGSYVGAHSVK